MAHVISLETSLFDPGKEPANPINPIAGHSLLAWLRSALVPRVELTEPDAEDWGWYSLATFEGREYLVGACVLGDAQDAPPLEWLIQIHKRRSLGEKLFGKNRMTPEDALSALIEAAVKAEPAFSKVERRIE